MKLFARGSRQRRGAPPVTADTPGPGAAAESAEKDPRDTTGVRFEGSTEELLAEIGRLESEIRRERSPAAERTLLRLRHLAGVRLVHAAPSDPVHPEPLAQLPEFSSSLPGIAPSQVTPGLLRAGILRDGCLLVPGLIPRAEALRLAAGIERSFAERERHDQGECAAEGYYEEFALERPFDPFLGRPWIKMGGGVYASDSPRLSFDVAEALRAANVPKLASDYLGEAALLSVHKTTLRKAEPSTPGTWHQDGKFMGPVRALNLWLALSRCGDVAPGLDIVPQRLDCYVTTGTEEATLQTQVSQAKAEQAAGERGLLRPIFEPGDALLFDELFLHQTAAEPTMPEPRFALEAWFFGGSAFPPAYAPIAI